jgi:hypothetical protein
MWPSKARKTKKPPIERRALLVDFAKLPLKLGYEGLYAQRAEMPSTIFEFGGPRVYSYEEFLGAVAHQAGLAPRLIPIRFAVWYALARVSEIFPSPLLTRNQVELMQIDTVSSPGMPGFVELGISPHSVEAILQKMLSNCG